MGLGAFDSEDPQSLYWFGMHGTVAGNWAVCDCDFLLCLGARFDDRITGKIEKFATEAKIAHIDIDISEHNKNKIVDLPITQTSNMRFVVSLNCGRKINAKSLIFLNGIHLFKNGKLSTPSLMKLRAYHSARSHRNPIPETKGDAIISTGVGQHQMWAAQYFQFREPRTYIVH